MTGRKRAVVTGGAGFVGAHLARRLAADGWGVLVVDDLSAGARPPEAAGIEVEVADVLAPAAATAIARWRPSVVFHLAAQVSVPRSMEDPERDLLVNVLGTRRIVDASRAAGAGRIVFVSSGGAVYGETARAAHETSPVRPRSYYGLHKLAAEGHVALSGLGHAIVRPSNLYGPGQRSGIDGAVIQAFVGQARRGGPLRIHGDGGQTRDFVHVRDAVEALLALGSVRESGTWNLARGRSVTISALADAVEAVFGPLGREHFPVRPGDVRDSRLAASPLRALGWRPRVRLRDGIREIARTDDGGRDGSA
jgi:UDP-glucose 4-epimerase